MKTYERKKPDLSDLCPVCGASDCNQRCCEAAGRTMEQQNRIDELLGHSHVWDD